MNANIHNVLAITADSWGLEALSLHTRTLDDGGVASSVPARPATRRPAVLGRAMRAVASVPARVRNAMPAGCICPQ